MRVLRQQVPGQNEVSDKGERVIIRRREGEEVQSIRRDGACDGDDVGHGAGQSRAEGRLMRRERLVMPRHTNHCT